MTYDTIPYTFVLFLHLYSLLPLPFTHTRPHNSTHIPHKPIYKPIQYSRAEIAYYTITSYLAHIRKRALYDIINGFGIGHRGHIREGASIYGGWQCNR